MIKKFLLLLTLSAQTLWLAADEGMWILSLLQKKEAAMQKTGLTLSAEDIYNVNESSLKDAIVWFNGGCTGEIISDQGLILTNHHCGYGQITALSTPEDNILDNGFYAKTHADERVPKKPMFVAILKEITDVTDQVLKALESAENETERAAKLKVIENQLKEEYKKEDYHDVRLFEMFKGNQYFIFVYDKYTDIRLVGTPPQNVGKFGGDTDNWFWPRHTGDFSLFRIYASPNNLPAPYSAENIPYKPKHHLPVSLSGVKEGDFAMILGFPGRTNRYEFSDAVQLALDHTNDAFVKMRDIRLKEWRRIMDIDLETRLSLSDNYARVANYWKYFIGQSEQLNRLQVVRAKRNNETLFTSWGQSNSEYANLMNKVKNLVSDYEPYAAHLYYIAEGVFTPEIMQNARFSYALNNAYENKPEEVELIQANYLKYLENRDWNPLLWEADKQILKKILFAYFTDVPQEQHPEHFAKMAQKFKFARDGMSGVEKYVDFLYKKSALSNQNDATKWASKLKQKSLNKDPLVQLYLSFVTVYSKEVLPKYMNFNKEKDALSRLYIQGLMEMQPERHFYADANSSIRLTYGSVEGYYSKDAVKFQYKTTIDGVMEKYVPGDFEFDLSEKFIELYNRKEFGKYAEDGTLYVNFLTNNDITGGNSGSPVINGQGHLIGLAFDGNWEAMSGDLYFDEKYKRTINVDIRYVLWCIEHLGEAPHIVNEMTLISTIR